MHQFEHTDWDIQFVRMALVCISWDGEVRLFMFSRYFFLLFCCPKASSTVKLKSYVYFLLKSLAIFTELVYKKMKKFALE